MEDSAAKTGHEPPVIDMTGVTAVSLQDQETPVLEGVNWSVQREEYWVVAGMHGTGKSDLLALTAGLLAPQQGSYRLFGHPMPIFEETLLAERLRVGLAFDGGQLFHQLTVRENLALPLQYHREARWQETEQQVNAMLELTELTEWADRTPAMLGRNWQKRAGLARALMLQPEVLLVDNPLGSLDPRHANWVLNFLDQLRAGHPVMAGRPMTLVVTTDDLRAWRNLRGHFAILREKQFLTLGHCPRFEDHQYPVVGELLAENLRPAGQPATLDKK